MITAAQHNRYRLVLSCISNDGSNFEKFENIFEHIGAQPYMLYNMALIRKAWVYVAS